MKQITILIVAALALLTSATASAQILDRTTVETESTTPIDPELLHQGEIRTYDRDQRLLESHIGAESESLAHPAEPWTFYWTVYEFGSGTQFVTLEDALAAIESARADERRYCRAYLGGLDTSTTPSVLVPGANGRIHSETRVDGRVEVHGNNSEAHVGGITIDGQSQGGVHKR